MKSPSFIVFGFLLGVFVHANQAQIFRKIKELKINKSFTYISERYGDYDPGMDKQFSKEDRDYFNSIAKQTEFNGPCPIARWTSNVKIYIEGRKPTYLINELNRIVEELNQIIEPIDITLVENKSESNYVIYLMSGNEYARIEPAAVKNIDTNWGLFVVNSGREIKKGSMYVDLDRCTSIAAQKHLLREELTQSLGLKNDTYDYPESIFYQNWTETTDYAPIDRRLIDMLYNYW